VLHHPDVTHLNGEVHGCAFAHAPVVHVAPSRQRGDAVDGHIRLVLGCQSCSAAVVSDLRYIQQVNAHWHAHAGNMQVMDRLEHCQVDDTCT
jgi:hypothetical protein